MRLWCIVIAAIALSGCNAVMSERPMFSAADAQGAPQLKPGFWSKAECGRTPGPADPKDCLDGVLVTPDTVRMVTQPKPGAEAPAGPPPSPAAYLLANGDPLVLQSKATAEFTGGLKTKGPTEAFIYMAISPKARDSAGKVIETDAWLVICGPPAPSDPPPKPTPGTNGFTPTTLHPFAGLKLTPLGCEPADKAAVRNAARQSRSAGEVTALRWLADAPPPTH